MLFEPSTLYNLIPAVDENPDAAWDVCFQSKTIISNSPIEVPELGS